MDEIRAKKYANWIVANKEKKGTPEFETVAKAYRLAKGTGEAVAQEVAPEEKPEETPSIGSQLYGAIPEIAKGFTRGLTVDPISGASSLAYNAARAADPSMVRFEDTGFGKKLAKAQEYLAPDDNGLITQAASGLGSLLSFIPGGLAKGALKVASLIGQSTSLASEEARARADQATLEGKPVSAKQQLTSQLLATPSGLLELIPAERLARPIKAIFSKVKADDIEQYAPTIFNRIKSVIATGSEEAIQEASSNIIQDLIQQGIYDPNLKIGESALANAEMGGAVGALAQTAVDFVTRGKMTQKYNRLKQEEGEAKIAEQVQAIKDKQDAKDKETIERFGIDPKQLFLPAPPKQIEEDETETDAVMNPLGLISHGELTPELVKQINDQRKADGKEKLKNFSIEDLVDAQVPQQNIDSILTSKANFTGEKTTNQDVINAAEERNIDIRGDGFSDFLARTTGSRELKGMSQPQLHAAFKSLSSMEKNESLTMLPTGTNAKRFTQEQYDKSVGNIKDIVFKETERLGRSSIIKEIKDYSGLENDSDAESLLNTAVKKGEFSLVKKPIFSVINNDGSVLRSYTKREDASKAALRDNLSVKDNLSVDVVRPDSVSDIDEVSAGFGFLKMLKQDIGLDIREGQFKQGVTPSAFEITTSDGVRIGTPHASMEAAEKASNTIREFRLAESKNFSAAADRALKSIDANNNSLLKMQSLGTASEIDLLKASANITKNNRRLEANAKKLRAQAESYAQPLTIAPKGEKVISKKGFTYFENDAPVATFDSREQAEKALLAKRTDAELATIVEKATKKGGATANRIIGSVQQEMSNRTGTEPKGFKVTFKSPDTLKKEEKAEARKIAEAKLSGAGVFTPELRVAAEKLSDKLRPLLDRLGLKDLRLNMVTSITTPSGDQADGEYSKKLIQISLLAEDPMRTLNHEAIHALKELGAFTKDQWRVLSNKAKSEWMETYNIKARYSGLDAEGQIEEAIADAFSDFAISPQPGMMGAIVAKIKSFFEALKNSMNDLGFQTYQDVFADVATGNLSSYSGKATTLGDTVKYQAKGYSDDRLAKDDLSQQPNFWKATAEDIEKAEKYFSENGVDPYTSEGQLTLPLSFDGKKYSIKQAYSEEKRVKAAKTTDRSGKPRVAKQLKNDPYTGLPLNQNGTVTLYYPTTNESARELVKSRVMMGHSPTANKIYLTNESSAAAIEDKVGLIDQPVGGANVLIQIDPALLHILEEHEDGRKDFFIPIAEGKAFEKKMRQVKLFTIKASRDKGLHADRTLSEVAKSVNDTVTAWANASAAERKIMQKGAKDVLREQHNIGNLFGANSKLEKTNIGDHGLTFNGKKVMSTGLGFSAAQKINDTQRATTCPMSANCEALCLGETSGGNLLYGGKGMWRAGPRLSQYLRTEALIVNPEAFAIAMVKQIESFRNAAKKLGYHPAIRLNVTSDFNPKTFENIMNLFPDVTFYDYTKLRGSKSIAPNHHLTYSSTGASQIVNNEVIYNKHSNWDKMVDSVLGRGLNVAMAFTSRTEMPKFVLDERTGIKFEVWNGDEYDARFLDPVGKNGKGLIIGLGNKDNTTSPEEAAKKHKGFFLDYNRKRDGDTLVIPDQSKIKEPVTQDSDKKYSIKRIDVDGVSRSKVNNKGQAIAATDEKLTNFWRWFGDSGVVDKDGNPMVVYHGTSKDKDFSAFNINKRGAWFTADAEDASSYAQDNDSRGYVYDIDSRKYVEKNASARVIPAYLSIKNPYTLTASEKKKLTDATNYQKAQRDVFDSIKMRGSFDGIDLGSGNWVVLDKPSQIKSATGNTGEFSAKNKDTKYSIRDRIPTNIQADINRTTHVREEAGYPKRIMAAVTPEGFQKHLLRFRQSYINRYESIERLSKRVAERFGIDELLAHTSAAASALFSDRASGVTASVLQNGVPVYANGMTTVSDYDGKVKGLITVLEPLAKRNDPYIYQVFQYYASVKRGGRLQAEGKENLFTNKDGAAYAAALEREFPEFVDVLKEYQKFNNGLVQYMKDTGVISAKDADLWTKNWDYIPFYRQMEGERTSGPQLFQSISGVSKPKELKGGTAKVDDFLETVVRNTRAAVEAGMKNVAAQRVIRDVVRMNEGEKVRFNHPDASDIVSIKVNGVTEKYKVRDPLLVESLKSLDMPEIPGLALFSKPADLLRNLVTKDPGFILVNLMRDSLSAYITSGTDMNPFIDTFKQFGNSLADSSPEVLALKKSGFFTGYEFSGDTQSSSEAALKELRKRTGTRTTAEKTFLPLTAMWGMLEKGSNASDLATRAEIYKRTLAETGNEAEALFRALEVMNFGRKGSSAGIRILSAIIPFFNARIQGLDVLYRSGFGQGVMANREQAQKSFMIRAMTMFALSSMYWFMASDDEEYEKASQETKDNNWIIEGFKIPIPFELGVIFKVIPERLLAYYFGSDTSEDLKDAIIRNLTSTMQVNLPQAILPAVEALYNYSSFTGEPIVGMGTEGLEEKYQYTASTSTLAKKIGEKAADFRGAFGLPILPESPQLIDHLIKGYTGTLGTYAVMAIDSILTNEGEPVKATLKFEQLPVFKRFLASKDATGTVSSYYDLKEEVEKAVQTMNMLERTGDYEGMKEYFKGEKGNLIAIRPYINALDKNISELRDLKRMIQSSSMSGDRKRDTLTSITRAENSITARIQDIKKFVYK